MGLLTDLLGGDNATSAPVKARSTAGDVAIASTTWVNIDTAIDLTIDAAVGDQLVYGINCIWGLEATSWGRLDVVTVVAGTVTNSFALEGAVGSAFVRAISGWYGPESVLTMLDGQSPPYTVVAGDISAGSVTLRLRGVTNGGAKSLLAGTDNPLAVTAMNLGPLQA